MRSEILFAACVTLQIAASACGKKEKGSYSFNVPPISPIVEGSAPSGLKDGASLNLGGQECNGEGTPSDVIACFKTRIMSKASPGPKEGEWYLGYVNDLDKRLAIGNSMTYTPKCSGNPTVAVELPASKGLNNMSDDSVSLNCLGTYSQMPGGWSGDFALGKANDRFYVMSRSSEPSKGTYYALAGSVDTAGTDVKLWYFSAYTNESGKQAYAVRLQANKATGGFAYNWVASDANPAIGNSYDFCDFYVRSNGTDALRISAREGSTKASKGCAAIDSTDFDATTAGTQAACVAATDTSKPGNAATCDSFSAFPEGGPGNTSIFDTSNLNSDAMYAATMELATRDLAAVGVASLADQK